MQVGDWVESGGHMRAIFIIRPVEPVWQVYYAKNPPTLTALKQLVGGYIEIVPQFTKLTYEGKHYIRGTAYMNEDGRRMQLPLNQTATDWWLRNLGKGPFWYKPEVFGTLVYYATEKP